MNIDDPKLCKRIFQNVGISGMSKNCNAVKFGIFQSFDASHPARINQFRRIDQILNDQTNRKLILSDFEENASKYLPPTSTTQDLYYDIYLSLLNFLSSTEGYLGFKKLPAGDLLKNRWLKWFNMFGEYIFSDSRNYGFLEDSISIGRTLIANNIGQGELGLITKLFFEERQIEVPKCIEDLKQLEYQNPSLLTEIYFEVSVRLVRGIDNIAYNLTYCIARDCKQKYPISERLPSNKEIKNYVLENLRFNPPIAKVSRQTNNLSDKVVDGITIKPNSNILFDIVKYNRSLNDKFQSDLNSKKSFGASFGSYTNLSCPAASFSIDISVKFLEMFWSKRRFIPKLIPSRSFDENARLLIAGDFFIREAEGF